MANVLGPLGVALSVALLAAACADGDESGPDAGTPPAQIPESPTLAEPTPNPPPAPSATPAPLLSDFGGNAIWRFDPDTEEFIEFPKPGSPSEVRQLHGRDGELWAPESAIDRLVVIRF